MVVDDDMSVHDDQIYNLFLQKKSRMFHYKMTDYMMYSMIMAPPCPTVWSVLHLLWVLFPVEKKNNY